MNDSGKNGAWIGVGLVAAAAIIVTENPVCALMLVAVLLAY